MKLHFKFLIFAAVMAMLILGHTPILNAEPAWQDANGVWWNNICRSSTTQRWAYLPNAQIVGTNCSIALPTPYGWWYEVGTVTPN